MEPQALPGAATSSHNDETSTKNEEISFPPWVMLDCLLCRPGGDDDGSIGCAALAYCRTSTGDDIGVGFSAAAPTLTSRLILHFRSSSSSSPTTSPYDDSPKLHRNAILLRFDFTFALHDPVSEEFFVYQASPTRLVKLPACSHRLINPEMGKNIGIVCRENADDVGGGELEFAVAHLTVNQTETLQTACPVKAKLCFMRSSTTCPWRTTKCVPIRHGEGHGDALVWWETDAVVPFGDSAIGWVDYLRGGILFCDDVFSADPELRYVPLPVHPYDGDCDPVMDGRVHQFAYRRVCVTTNDDGAPSIKFVDVAPIPDQSRRPAGITSWTLSGDRRTWVEDGRIDVVDFLALAKRHGLPCVLPEFPVVDVKEPNIIYCVMREGDRPRSAWEECFSRESALARGRQAVMVAVDMSNKTLLDTRCILTQRARAS
ncbi:hypothetical protein EJB05_03903, partial [Eragrostis curvula]